MDKQAQRDLEELLARDMGGVAVAPPPVTCPTDVAHRWNLPTADIESLMSWGLPLLSVYGEPSHLPSADFQSELEPVVNLSAAPGAAGAGDLGRSRISGPMGYRLATSSRRLYAASEREGAVFAIATQTSSPVALVNTSVTAFVECAWRWWRALDIVGPLEDEDDETYWWCLERFAAWAVDVDPGAKTRSTVELSWWESVALS
ncbi:SUKH-4 family immunity protein [Streptomyces sp. NPDC001514]